MMNWKNLSNEDNPILFFDFFFGSGLEEFYDNFFGINNHAPGNEDLFAPENLQITNTPDREGIWSITNEEKEAGGTGYYTLFIDELNKLLKDQQDVTLSIIAGAVLKSSSPEQAKHYLKTLIIRLTKLISVFPTSPLMEKYPITLWYLYDTIKSITQNNPHVLTISEVEGLIKQRLPPTPNNQSEGASPFKIVPKYQPKIPGLYSKLMKEGFIDGTTTLEAFNTVFTGLKVEDKIHWIKPGKNKDVSKPLIIHFFKTLMNAGIINNLTDKQLKAAIPLVVIDKLGEDFIEINNMQQSFHSYKIGKKSTPEYLQINQIVSWLKD